MSSLRSSELSLIDEVFRGGERNYVLDFSNRYSPPLGIRAPARRMSAIAR